MGVANALSQRWQNATNLSGVTTASLLVVLLVSTALGALTGLLLDGHLSPLLVAALAGLAGTIGAAIIRNTLLVDAWGAAGIEDPGTPAIVVTYAAIASLAGSLAADRLGLLIGWMPAIVLGSLSGLLSAVLFGLLMVTYRINPNEPQAQR